MNDVTVGVFVLIELKLNFIVRLALLIDFRELEHNHSLKLSQCIYLTRLTDWEREKRNSELQMRIIFSLLILYDLAIGYVNFVVGRDIHCGEI